MINLAFTLNGQKVQVQVEDNMRLLDLLRETLGLSGTKEGCSVGECGACTVIMNGEAVNSCMIMAEQCHKAVIETVENLAKDEVLSRLQQSFLDNGAIQCGFCTPGMLMSAKALLDKVPQPSEDQIKEALEGNLCRCTGYIPILNSIKEASGKKTSSKETSGTK